MEKNKGWNTLPFLLKYCDALEWGNSFTWALNGAKNIDYEKCFEQKLFVIKFPAKNSMDDISIYSRSGARWPQKFAIQVFAIPLQFSK